MPDINHIDLLRIEVRLLGLEPTEHFSGSGSAAVWAVTDARLCVRCSAAYLDQAYRRLIAWATKTGT